MYKFSFCRIEDLERILKRQGECYEKDKKIFIRIDIGDSATGRN